MIDSILPLHDVPLCLDGRMLAADGTGVSQYAHNLRRAMRTLGRTATLEAGVPYDGRVRRWLASLRSRPKAGSPAVVAGETDRFTLRDVFRRAHLHFSMFGRPLRVTLPGPPGVMHWTYPVPLRIDRWANLYTVHDAIPFGSPHLTPIDPRRHCAVLAALGRHAARFVAISSAARSEILATTSIAPGRVIDCGQGIDVEGMAGALPAGLVRHGYYIACGSIEPRKNGERLLAAYRASGVTFPLIFVGPCGWRGAPILTSIAATPGAVHLGYVDRATLLRLLADARALLFPSLHEGFGLPLAEAMALGTPVITSRDGALAEVAGGAALLVDPFDVGGMADVLMRLDTNAEVRAALSVRGPARASAFTVAAFAARLAPVYRAAYDAR